MPQSANIEEEGEEVARSRSTCEEFIMRVRSLPIFLALVLSAPAGIAADTRVYELRSYHVAAGKLDALHARFRDHMLTLLEKHGITNVAYFVHLDNSGHRLICLLSYPSREAREKSWKAFQADPEWQKA